MALAENIPKGPTLAAHLDRGSAERNAVFADFEHALRAPNARGGEFRDIGIQTSVKEVEHVVAGRTYARGESGPCHRRKRRERSAQSTESPLFGQTAEVR